MSSTTDKGHKMTYKKQTGHFKSFDGTSIYYEVRGEGTPVILTYGIACTINHWRPQVKYFSNYYKTIVFDYRGCHRSSIPLNKQFSIDDLSQDIKALMKHLGLKKAHFWGHSFGAQVLIRTYDMFPHLFESLIFINGFASNPLRGVLGIDITDSAFKLMKQGYDQLPETLSYLWKKAVSNSILIKLSALAGGFNLNLTNFKDVEIYAKGVSNVDLDVFLELFGKMLSYDGTTVLERITIPTLIIGGLSDTITPFHYQETLHHKILKSEILLIPMGSHCTHLDMPDFVNLRIEKFLKAIS